MSPTRKRLSLQDKIKILDDCSKGVKVKEISLKYGIPRSSVSTIKKDAKKIKKYARTPGVALQRRSMRRGEFPKMEEALYRWFISRQEESNQPIDGAILQAKAKELQKELYDGAFLASDSWLHSFKRRFGIGHSKSSTGPASYAEMAATFKEKLEEVMQQHNLSLDAVYHAEDFELFWKLLPVDNCAEDIDAAQRLRFLACANASGSKKIAPVIINEAESDESGSFFKNWFFENFAPKVEDFLNEQHLPQRAILLIDEAFSYSLKEELVKPTGEGQISVLYIPSLLTASLPLMEQHPIRLMRLYYRYGLLDQLVKSDRAELKLSDAEALLGAAWDKLPSTAFTKRWPYISGQTPEQEDEDDIPLGVLRHQEQITLQAEALELANILFWERNFEMHELEAWINAEEADCMDGVDYAENSMSELSDSEEASALSEPDTMQKEPSSGLEHSFQVCIKWAEQNNIESSKILLLKNLQENARLKTEQNEEV